MIMAKMWARDTDVSLDDPIKLVEPERTRVSFESCDLTGTEIIDYGYKVEVQESDLQDSAVLLSMGKPSLDVLSHERSNVITHSLSVKLVDCKTFPWYFKKYKRRIYNIMATGDLGEKNGNIVEVNLIDDENSSSNSAPLRNCTNIDMYKVMNEVKKKSHRSLDSCLDFIKQNALKQKGCSKIDFKKNKGLVGLSIKRNVRYEKLKKTENTSKVVSARISGSKRTCNDGSVCEYIVENETTATSTTSATNNDIENTKISMKLKSIASSEMSKGSLTPGSYKLSHLTTGEKVITLVKSSQHSLNPKKIDSPKKVSTPTKDENFSRILRSCIKKSDKASTKPKSIKNKKINVKSKSEKMPIPKKTIEKLFNRPMPKSRKLQLQKQRKENERKTKKSINIIDNTGVTSQVIVFGSHSSEPSKEVTDMKSLVESKILNTSKKPESEVSLKIKNRSATDNVKTTSLRNIKPFINKHSSRGTSDKSPKISSNSHVQSLDNSNLCGRDLTKSHSNSNNLTSETQTNSHVATSKFDSTALHYKDTDKMCLVPSKDDSVGKNCDHIISTDTINFSMKSVDNSCSEPLNKSCPNTSSSTCSNPSSVLPSVDNTDQFYLQSDNNLQVAVDLCQKSSVQSNLSHSNKISDEKSVNNRLEKSNNLQLEYSNNRKSNICKVLYPNTDTACSKSIDAVYTHSHIISKSTDKSFNSVSNLPNDLSTQCAQNGEMQQETPPNTTKNMETESVCNIEHEIKNESVDSIINVVSNTCKESKPQNKSSIPQNNQKNSAIQNNNDIVPQNNKTEVQSQNNVSTLVSQNDTSNALVPQNNNYIVPQNNQGTVVPQTVPNDSSLLNNNVNIAEDTIYEYTNKNTSTLSNPFPCPENTLVAVNKPQCPVNVPTKKPYIVRIKNPIPSDRLMHVDNIANIVSQYQGPQPSSWDPRFDSQRPIFQEMPPPPPNLYAPPPYIPEHQNNPNNFFFGDHYTMPGMNPPMPAFIPQSVNWPPPSYFWKDGLWNSNYPMQSNNSNVGTNHDASTKKVNICPKYSSAPRHDVTNATIENLRAGKNLVNIPLKQNVTVGPSTTEPVKTRLQMQQELDSFIAPSSNALIPVNNLQKSTNIPVQPPPPVPSLLSVKPGALTQKPTNPGEFSKTKGYSTGILPTYENMPPKHLSNQLATVRKPLESVKKSKAPNRRYSTDNTNKQKITLAEYKKRGCS